MRLGDRVARRRNALARFNQVKFEDEQEREQARTRLLKAAKRIGLQRHLTKHVPTKGGVSVGQTLLAEAGVAFRVTPDGGLVPEVGND